MIDEKVSVAALLELLDLEAPFCSTEPEVFAFIHPEPIYQMITPCQVFLCKSPFQQSPHDPSVKAQQCSGGNEKAEEIIPGP